MIGKRGEDGRVIAGFRQADLAMMRPADQVAVRTCGHGSRPTPWPAEVTVLNLGPGLLPALPISVTGTGVLRPRVDQAGHAGLTQAVLKLQ